MSKQNINITMPCDISEVTLKTAGKYCDKDIVVKNNWTVETGDIDVAISEDGFTITATIPNADASKGRMLKRLEIINNEDDYPNSNFTATQAIYERVHYIRASDRKIFVQSVDCSTALCVYFVKSTGLQASVPVPYSENPTLSIDTMEFAFTVPTELKAYDVKFTTGTYIYKAYYMDEYAV